MTEKYETLFNSFKSDTKFRFLFAYWIIIFNVLYILLIFALQNVPIIQCSSIVLLTTVFLIFSSLVRPFKELAPGIQHFFNLFCIDAAGGLNLYLAIMNASDPDFEGTEHQGLGIFIIIMVNIVVNSLISIFTLLAKLFCWMVKKRASKEAIKKEKARINKLSRRSIQIINESRNDSQQQSINIISLCNKTGATENVGSVFDLELEDVTQDAKQLSKLIIKRYLSSAHENL